LMGSSHGFPRRTRDRIQESRGFVKTPAPVAIKGRYVACKCPLRDSKVPEATRPYVYERGPFCYPSLGRQQTGVVGSVRLGYLLESSTFYVLP
jgi:hypothetical protein